MTNMHTPRYEEQVYQSINDNETQHRMNILGLYDVICGRHKAAFDNIGNRRFRVLVALAHEKYTTAPTRAHKSIVIKDIVDSVHNGGGRFLQRLGCSWVELDEKQTHDKVGHALRDMAVASKSKSINKKARNVSMDFSDRSNSSKSYTTVGNTSTATLSSQGTNRDQNCRGVVDGYIVSFSNTTRAANADDLALSICLDDFDFDENDTSLEPIPLQSCSRTNSVDENTVSQIFAHDDNAQSTMYYSL